MTSLCVFIVALASGVAAPAQDRSASSAPRADHGSVLESRDGPAAPHAASGAAAPSAQEKGPEPAQPVQETPATVLVIPLKYTTAEEVAKVLSRIYPQIRIVADAATNSVIVSASAEGLEDIAKTIESLDVKVPSKTDPQIMRLIPIHAHLADDLIGVLRAIPSIRASLVDQNRGVVLSGAEFMVNQVVDMIRDVDAPIRTGRAEFYFLKATTEAAADSANLPALLKDILPGLKHRQNETLQLLTTLNVAVEDNASFSHRGLVSREGYDKLELSVQGRTQIDRDGADCHLDLKVAMNQFVTVNAGQNAPQSNFSLIGLDTRVTTKINQLLLVGSFPVAFEDADELLILVRVIPAN